MTWIEDECEQRTSTKMQLNSGDAYMLALNDHPVTFMGESNDFNPSKSGLLRKK